MAPGLANITGAPPLDPLDFYMDVMVVVGFRGLEGGEWFDLTVCSPNRLVSRLAESLPAILDHYVVMARYDAREFETIVMEKFNGREGDSIDELMIDLSQHGTHYP